MPLTELDRFSKAWQMAAQHEWPPSATDVERLGANVCHPGFALLGRFTKPGRLCDQTMYKVITAGRDHFERGGIKAGDHLDAIFHAAMLQNMLDLYDRIATAQTPHHWHCTNMVRNEAALSYARVLAPVKDDVGDGRCLVGLWIWNREPDAS